MRNHIKRSVQRLKLLAIAGLLLVTLGAVAANAQVQAGNCDSMAKQALPNATITLARSYAANEFKLAEGAPLQMFKDIGTSTPAFCRVTATLRPTSDSEIRIEVWLPANWNGKFYGAGSMGWAGMIFYEGLIEGLQHGYAVATSDAGHDKDKDGNGGAFLQGHPEKLIDYTYRSNHEMTLVAKQMIQNFYGKGPQHSYWFGCSLGGMQGFNEARLYPGDYDAIVVGASGNPFANINAEQMYGSWLVARHPEYAITQDKLKMVSATVVKACDELDGVKDGVIEDPRECKWKPEEILCKPGETNTENCLTAGQVEYINLRYAGSFNPRTGERILPGPPRGAEATMSAHPDEKSSPAIDLYRYVVYQAPNWDWKTFDFDSGFELGKKKAGPYFHTNPDQLKDFFAVGGKVIIWTGWNDMNSPYQWMNYRKGLVKAFGEESVQKNVRMFWIPGMGHCIGGNACDFFDRVGAVETWIEQGKAPEVILAKRQEQGKVVRTRLLCAYPNVDKYKGTGDPNDSANWSCVKGAL